MQVSLFWSKSAKDAVDKLVQKKNQILSLAIWYEVQTILKTLMRFRIADLDDRISLRYQRQLDNDLNGINPYGAFFKYSSIYSTKDNAISPYEKNML